MPIDNPSDTDKSARISVCDRPEKFESLKEAYNGSDAVINLFLFVLTYSFPGAPGITVYSDGHAVSRMSDFIMYSVEAEYIDKVVAQYGPCPPISILSPSHSLTSFYL